MNQARVCRVCGYINTTEGARRCRNCWLSLEGAPTALDPVGLRLARFRRLRFLRNRLARWGMLLAVAAGFTVWGVLVFFELGPNPPSPTTSISASVGPQTWAQARRTAQNTGHTPEPAPVPGRIKWTYDTGKRLVTAPSVEGNSVFFTTEDGSVIALDRDTGRLLWEYVSGRPTSSTPAIAGDLVVVGLRPGYMLALDRKDGSTVWQQRMNGGVFTSAVVVDGTIYIGDSDKKVYALDLATGKTLWDFKLDDWAVAPVSYVDNKIVVASQGRVIHILDTVTGRKRFVYDTGFGRNSRGGAAVRGDMAYFSALRGIVFAIDTRRITYPFERAILYWKLNLYVWNVLEDPPIQKGTAWGRIVGGSLVRTPTVDDDTVYVTNEQGKVAALDRFTGADRWSAQLGVKITTAPTVAGETVLVGTDDGRVFGLDAGSGDVKWKFEAGSTVNDSPTVVGDTMYVVTESGKLHAVTGVE